MQPYGLPLHSTPNPFTGSQPRLHANLPVRLPGWDPPLRVHVSKSEVWSAGRLLTNPHETLLSIRPRTTALTVSHLFSPWKFLFLSRAAGTYICSLPSPTKRWAPRWPSEQSRWPFLALDDSKCLLLAEVAKLHHTWNSGSPVNALTLNE